MRPRRDSPSRHGLKAPGGGHEGGPVAGQPARQVPLAGRDSRRPGSA